MDTSDLRPRPPAAATRGKPWLPSLVIVTASAANRLRYTRRAVRANPSLAGDPEWLLCAEYRSHPPEPRRACGPGAPPPHTPRLLPGSLRRRLRHRPNLLRRPPRRHLPTWSQATQR